MVLHWLHFWQTLIVSTDMWRDLKCTSHNCAHQTSAATHCSDTGIYQNQLTHFGIWKTELLSVASTHFQCLTISAKLKAIQRQMKTSENNIKCISGAGLIYRDAKECYMFSSHVCFHAMKNPFIVQCRTCAFSKSLCRFYYRYLKRNTEKSDNINTNCPVATWI